MKPTTFGETGEDQNLFMREKYSCKRKIPDRSKSKSARNKLAFSNGLFFLVRRAQLFAEARLFARVVSVFLRPFLDKVGQILRHGIGQHYFQFHKHIARDAACNPLAF